MEKTADELKQERDAELNKMEKEYRVRQEEAEKLKEAIRNEVASAQANLNVLEH